MALELESYGIGKMNAVKNYDSERLIDAYFNTNFKSSFQHKYLGSVERYHNVRSDIEILNIA